MGKKVTKPVMIVVFLLIVLVILFMLRGSLRGPARVVLPEETQMGDSGLMSDDIDRIEIRPDTVQSAIETLMRPQQYGRSVYIERYYSGGSAVQQTDVFVSGEWTRLDTTLPGGEVRYVISDGETSYIWYGSSKEYFSGAAALSADEEQSIPTYEDILALDVQRIALADYRLLESTDCIYVETAPDGGGYTERYWVALGSGLLIAAEKVHAGEVVYRMAGLTLDMETVREDAFTLPDGTVLYTIE